jgi:hypothetical protein
MIDLPRYRQIFANLVPDEQLRLSMFPPPFHRAAITKVFLWLAALLVAPSHVSASVIYPTLPPGSEYQLIFVTSGARDAMSKNIADYNAFVTAQAELNPSFPAGVTWSAVASTAAVAARDNAVNPPGVPVYNTAGMLLCSGTSGLYNTLPLLAAPNYDENGGLNQAAVWTGSAYDGTIDGGLGNGVAGAESTIVGFPETLSNWLFGSVATPDFGLSLYGLSSPITVPAPEPSTLALLVPGLVALAAIICARHRG